MSKRSDTDSSCLDLRWLLPDDMRRLVEEGHREEHVVAAQLRHVVVKEVVAEAFSEASLIGFNKQQRVDGERGRGSHGGLLDGIRLLPWRSGGRSGRAAA